jgi:glycosyltransferase involved in cell wall biosynthesis
MSVAVVIPLFNGAPWISATLRSVIEQTEPPSEIVVVDDGSTDGSPEIARQFPAVRVLQNPSKGVHHARRHGVSLTGSPLVAILDQDDLWHPRHLAEMTRLLGQHRAPAAVGGCQAFSDAAELRMAIADGRSHPLDLWESFPHRPIWTPSCVVFRRSALEAIGGWPTQFRFGADVHTWWRFSESEPLVRSESVTVGYRVHAGSLSAQLRANAPADYSAAAAEATAAALASFRQVGRKVAGLEERWATHLALGELVKAALDDEDDRLRAVVRRYAESLRPHSPQAIRDWHGVLFYHLFAQGTPWMPRGERRRLLRLVAAWSPDSSPARQLLIEAIHVPALRWSLMDQLRREPFKAQDWLLWLQVARGVIARRYSPQAFERLRR